MALIYDGFYDAKTARDIAIGGKSANSDVLSEINALQMAIDLAAGTNNLYVIVDSDSNTVMTTDAVYYDALTDTTEDEILVNSYRLARAKMDQVIKYFTLLGYSVKRDLDAINSRIAWNIRW